jgi:hypothetical protein
MGPNLRFAGFTVGMRSRLHPAAAYGRQYKAQDRTATQERALPSNRFLAVC